MDKWTDVKKVSKQKLM